MSVLLRPVFRGKIPGANPRMLGENPWVSLRMSLFFFNLATVAGRT